MLGGSLQSRRHSPARPPGESFSADAHDKFVDLPGGRTATFPVTIILALCLLVWFVVSIPHMLAWAEFQGAQEHLRRKADAATPRASANSKPQEPARPAARVDGFDVIIVAGGGQTPTGPPEHVVLRLQKAKEMYDAQKPRPRIITTGRGTTHKPCPHDKRGFEIDEASMDAKWLIDHGVSPSHILTETASWETIGNAFFARVMHVDLMEATKLAVINNGWHMPRTKAVFGHVFSVAPFPASGPYEVTFVEVADGLAPDVLAARLSKEKAATPRFMSGGHWQAETSTLAELHKWMYTDHASYSSKRLLNSDDEGSKEVIDPVLAKSY